MLGIIWDYGPVFPNQSTVQDKPGTSPQFRSSGCSVHGMVWGEAPAEPSTCGLAWYLGLWGSVHGEEPAEPSPCGIAWYLELGGSVLEPGEGFHEPGESVCEPGASVHEPGAS